MRSSGYIRVIPQGHISASFSHGCSHCQANSVGSTRDNDDLAVESELLNNVGRGVWEGLGESLPDLGAILKCHGHGGGSSQISNSVTNRILYLGDFN